MYKTSTSKANNASASATASFPVFGLAFVVLFILKVAGLAGASWGLAALSWWWVFAPLLIGLGLFIVALVIILIVAVIVSIFS